MMRCLIAFCWAVFALVESHAQIIHSYRSAGSGNATVPGDALIQPAQQFVDTLYDGLNDGAIIGGGTVTPVQMHLESDGLGDGVTTVTVLYPIFDFSKLYLDSSTALTTVKFPLLESMSNESVFHPTSIATLTTLSFPVLTTLNSNADFGASDCPALETVELPLLATISSAGIDLSGTHVLPDFPSLTTLSVSYLNFSQCYMSSAQIDAFLNALASTVVTGTGSTIDVSAQRAEGGDPSGAAPTSASAAARTYLAGLGVTITHD